jgi:O-antigen ligase
MQQYEKVDQRYLYSKVNTWLLCVALLVFASLYGFSFEHGGGNTITSQAASLSGEDAQTGLVIRIQNAGTYILCILLMVPLIRSIGTEFRRNVLISALLIWAIASCAWSNNPAASATNGVRIVLDISLACFLVNRYTIGDLLKILVLVGSVAAAGSLFLVFFMPQYGLQERTLSYAFGAWQGIFGQKNICGAEMTLLLLPAFFVRLSGSYARLSRTVYVIAVLTIIAMTRSAGAWVVCGACLLFVVAMNSLRKLAGKDSRVAVLGLLGILVVLGMAIAGNFATLTAAIGKDTSMSGRTAIWAGLFRVIMQRPMLGYGFMAFWQGLTGSGANVAMQLNTPGMAYAENGVVELLVELGAVGLLLYVLVFLRAVKDAAYCFRRDPSPTTLWFISMLFYVVVSNIGGGWLLWPSNLACIVPFVTFLGLRQEVRRIRDLQVQ